MVDLKIHSPTTEARPRPKMSPGTGAGATSSESEKSFQAKVKTIQREKLDGDLKGILDQVRNRGRLFLAGPSQERLETYKDGLKQFLDRVKKEIFSLKNELGPEKDGQQKVFQLIETVDSEIDGLTRETLQQDKALALLASLDDIRGLALDILS